MYKKEISLMTESAQDPDCSYGDEINGSRGNPRQSAEERDENNFFEASAKGSDREPQNVTSQIRVKQQFQTKKGPQGEEGKPLFYGRTESDDEEFNNSQEREEVVVQHKSKHSKKKIALNETDNPFRNDPADRGNTILPPSAGSTLLYDEGSNNKSTIRVRAYIPEKEESKRKAFKGVKFKGNAAQIQPFHIEDGRDSQRYAQAEEFTKEAELSEDLDVELIQKDRSHGHRKKQVWGNSAGPRGRESSLSRAATKFFDDTAKNKKLAGRSQLNKIMSNNRKNKISSAKKRFSVAVPNASQLRGLKRSESNLDDSNDEDLNRSRSQLLKAGMSQFASQMQQTAKKPQETPADLRGIFIDDYGVSLEFPAYYYHSAKFVPHFQQYVVTMGFHIIPKASNANVQTTFIDGRVEDNTYDEIYEDTGDSILLTLSECQGRAGFKKVKELQLTGVRKALMEFSPSGKYFGIFLQKENIFNIFDSTDISQCFEYIKQHTNQNSALMSCHIDEDKFQKSQRIVFDLNDNYVSVVSQSQIMIYSLKQHEVGKLIQDYSIDIDKYEAINDIVIDSGGCTDYRYKCHIACKASRMTSIHVFDINQADGTRQISYMKQGSNLTVKISRDLRQVILSNGVEHYMHNGENQQIFPWIKDKFLRKAVSCSHGFYLITSKDYDRDIDILNSYNQDFNVSVKRSIEPGLLIAFDAVMDEGCEDHRQDQGNDGDLEGKPDKDKISEPKKKTSTLRTLIKIGDYLYQDTYNLELATMSAEDCAEHKCVETTIQKFYGGYGFNWPYFSYATQNKKVLILNCFNPNFVQRYQLPGRTSNIQQTHLTDTNDFFAIVETDEGYFEIYHIDLDADDPRVNGPILKYSFADVDGRLLTGFHVRGSSQKEKINLNKSLMIFMQHGSTLWAWTGQKLRKIEDDVSNFYYLSDDQVFYMKTTEIKLSNGKKVQHSVIMTLEALFGSYKISEVYRDKDIRAEMLNFGVDNTRKRLIILTGIKNHKNTRDKFVTLYEIDTEKTLVSLMVESREIIGRLKSNLYNFVEGHIYYRNKVIKVRYDQLERNKGAQILEEQLFDHYSDILQLNNPNNVVQSGTPLQTCLYNRLAYIIRNQKDLKARKILVMPYLHERRIYLNRRHSANQFYSLIDDGNQRYIYCMCLDSNKIYIYTDTGILLSKIPYGDLAAKCGKPQELSENAQYFVFRKGDYNVEISIVKLTIEGLTRIQTYNIKQVVSDYLLQQKGIDPRKAKQLHRFWQQYLVQLDDMKKVKLNFCMNDSGDVLVRLKPTAQHQKKVQKELDDLRMFHGYGEVEDREPENCSFFLYIANEEEHNKGTHIYFDSEHDEIVNLQGVSMNDQFIFFWNLGRVWKLCLLTKALSRLSFYVSEAELQTSIKQVRTGSNENLICVRVTQTPTQDCIIVWDLEKDLEMDSFDVQSNALFFQDKDGNPYMAEKDYIINCIQGCKLKCYRMKVTDFELPTFGFMYGHRVALDSHNYIIFRNYINLSFSYMTFVIKDNFDKSGFVRNDYLFDVEGYDYILKKKNIFFEGDLVKQQYEKLNFILKNYYNVDPILLESLQYKNEESGQIPLHLALEANNNRMVNLILSNMAKIDFAAVNLIKDIFSQLINFQDFVKYLKQSPFQSVQMINKQTLRLYASEQEDEEIIIVRPSPSSYIDEAYFKQSVGEHESTDHSAKTFAVKVECVKADWIINDQIGRYFLIELLRQQNKDVFMTKYVQIIVQFLYNNFKNKIITYLMPFYIVHTLLTMALIYHSSTFPDYVAMRTIQEPGLDLRVTPDAELLEGDAHSKAYHGLEEFSLVAYIRTRDILVASMGLLTCQLIYQFYKQSVLLKWLTLKRGWSLVDLVIIICNLIVAISLGSHINEEVLRVIEALMIVFQMAKCLYFLRFVGEIAPLVDIIFVIMGDIKYFMVIFIIVEVAFVTAYYCIGRNQRLDNFIATDGGIGEDYNPPGYATFMGAIDHVYLSSLGEFDTEAYFGEDHSFNTMTPILILLFVGLSFFMCIHLLNMLIAIMGESFSQNNEVREAKKKISQLQFVVENWWLDPIKDKQKIVYLVAAFNIEDEDQDMEKFEKLNEKVDENSAMMQALMKEMKNMQASINALSSRNNGGFAK